MDFIITEHELGILCGLPHIQQLVYIRGIRPYMDVKTQITGIKRRISHQSISEQLYIEPHQGIKAQSFTRAQVRRAIESLERVGLVENQSRDKQLVLKCVLASKGYFGQNKVITNPSQQVITQDDGHKSMNTGISNACHQNSDAAKTAKAVTPLKENNYLYLLSRFEQFWNLYPERKSKGKTFDVFKSINPDESLFRQMMQGLQAQIENRQALKAAKNWVAPWKYPFNWLEQYCWEDSLTPIDVKEKNNATNRKRGEKHANDEHYCMPEGFEFETEAPELPDNVYAWPGK